MKHMRITTAHQSITFSRRMLLLGGAAPPLVKMIPAVVISICAFPIVAWIVSRIDAWRLGR